MDTIAGLKYVIKCCFRAQILVLGDLYIDTLAKLLKYAIMRLFYFNIFARQICDKNAVLELQYAFWVIYKLL